MKEPDGERCQLSDKARQQRAVISRLNRETGLTGLKHRLAQMEGLVCGARHIGSRSKSEQGRASWERKAQAFETKAQALREKIAALEVK